MHSGDPAGRKAPGDSKNLRHNWAAMVWNHDDPAASLREIDEYAEDFAARAIDWYYRKKASKAWFSRLLRYCAILFMAFAGLLPILAGTWEGGPAWLWQIFPKPARADLLVSLFVGLAATCIALDRFGGFSTGWIRYIRTAAELERLRQEYRLDWAKLDAEGGARPSSANVEARITRAREFVVGVQGLVLQETQAWATEFESNLSQMEKEAKESFDRERQEMRAKLEESKPGCLCVTVANAHEADGLEFRVTLEGTQGRIADGETVAARDTWTRLALPAGTYSILVTAKIGGKPASAAKIAEVAPGKTQTERLTLLRAGAGQAG